MGKCPDPLLSLTTRRERIDRLLERTAYADLPIADALNAELDRAQNVFATRDAERCRYRQTARVKFRKFERW